MSNFRVSHTAYEGNTRWLGKGLSKYCMLCGAHCPYLPGGRHLGMKGLKYWVCKLHAKPTCEK